MEPVTLTAIIGGVVTVVTGYLTYLGAKNSAKKDNFITDRQQLSQDQQLLRAEMREEMKQLRDEVRAWRDRYLELEDNIEELKITNMKLQMEVDQWKEKYTSLLIENESLTARVNELEGQLKRRRKGDQLI